MSAGLILMSAEKQLLFPGFPSDLLLQGLQAD